MHKKLKAISEVKKQAKKAGLTEIELAKVFDEVLTRETPAQIPCLENEYVNLPELEVYGTSNIDDIIKEYLIEEDR